MDEIKPKLDVLDIMDKAMNKEKGKMAEIRVFVNSDLRSQFKSQCALANKTMSEVIAELMENFTKSPKNQDSDRNL